MRLRVIALLSIVVLVAAGVWLLIDYFTIDACLDGGGRWNYASGVCERG